MDVTDFQRRVYDVCSRIPKGRFSTYQAISLFLHSSPQAVGQALRQNPFAPKVPCHRVIKSDFGIGGFFGQSGENNEQVSRKISLLQSEGIVFDESGFVSPDSRERLLTSFSD